MQIRPIVKTLFSSQEVQSLAEKILAVTTALVATQPVIAILSQSLDAALKKLKAARKNSQHNTQTELLAQADEVRDLAFRAFITYAEAAFYRQNEAFMTAAAALQQHVRKFDKGLVNLGYVAETAELDLFIAEMEKAAQYIEAINATEWFGELKSAQKDFLGTHDEKTQEEVEKNVLIPTKEAKELTFSQLIAITHTLNGLAMAGMEGIADINQKVDQVIEEVERPARARFTRKQNEKDETEDQDIAAG